MDFRAPFTPDEIYQPMRHPNVSHLPSDAAAVAASAMEDATCLLNDLTISQYQAATAAAGYQQPSVAGYQQPSAAAAVAVQVQQNSAGGVGGIPNFNAQGGIGVSPLHHKLSASASEFVPNFPPPGVGPAGNGNSNVQNRVQQPHYPQPQFYAQQQQQQQQQQQAGAQRFYNGIQQPKDLNQQQQQYQQQQQLSYNSNQVGGASVQDRLRLVNNGGGNNRNAQAYQQQQQPQQQSYYGQHHSQSQHKTYTRYGHLAQSQQQILHHQQQQQRAAGGGNVFNHQPQPHQQHHQQQQNRHHQQHHHHQQQQQQHRHHSLQHQKDDLYYNSASGGSSGATPSSSSATSSSNSNTSITRNQSAAARSSSTGGGGGEGDTSNSSHPDMETIALEYLDTVIHCLNQNPGQFDAIAPRFLTIFEGMENNNYVLSIAMEDIFEKSIENPNFRYMGAKLYNLLHMMNPKRDSLFHTLLKCKLDFHQQEVCQLNNSKQQHKVRETALFLAELYMQLRGDDSRIHLLAVNIMHSLKQLLFTGIDNVNIRCICQTLKLAGCDLSIDCPEDMFLVLNELNAIEKSKPNVYPIIDNVLKLQRNNWGRKVSNSLGEGDSVPPAEPLRMSDEPVFYGPDGRELTAEETDFLADGTPACEDDYENGGDDDDEFDDDGGELDQEMDEETKRSYKDFCKQQMQQQQQQQRQQYNSNIKKQYS